MNRMRVVSLLGLSLVAATPALAQMQALPVYFSPKGGTGITIDGDFGRLSYKNDGVTQTNKPTALGGRAYLGLPVIRIGIGASVYDPKIQAQRSETQYMGSVAFKLFGGPLVPVAISLQAGAGYLKQGTGTAAVKTVSVPIGLGFGINIPTPGASLEPWAAARGQINATSSGTTSSTRIGWGVSGGINLGLPMGLGAHVAVDMAHFGAKTPSPKLEVLTVGAGIHYTIKLPGVPIVPGI